jgi:small GTP-binding protein
MPCPYHSSHTTLCATGDPDYFDVRVEFYKNNINGILFVFDVTNDKSFESLVTWLEEADKYGISSETVKVVIGNKIDLYPREVTEQQGNSFANRHKATYFETSAKTGASVEEGFQFILHKTCK